MELLEIKKYPDKILRKRCQPIEKIAERELELFEKMLFTMRHFSGIGLAAPQIGILQRLIVADVGEGAIKLANPEIIKVEGIDNMAEGCLSIPDVTVDIERPYEVIVKGLNEKGETVEAKAKGLLARVLQHETDHLKGKLIIDYARFLQKIKFKLKK
ncbi:MAG: peptide deformylase [Candidatus Omnitrophica bacterium]|nr:peptide deformylase [Candidatus Omnitrophota bacterium]